MAIAVSLVFWACATDKAAQKGPNEANDTAMNQEPAGSPNEQGPPESSPGSDGDPDSAGGEKAPATQPTSAAPSPIAPSPIAPNNTVPDDATEDTDKQAEASAPDTTGPDSPTEPATRPPSQNDIDTPRDLRVLPKSWSRKRVETFMKTQVERGLGVKCSYCHQGTNYAANHPKKNLARQMMRMTNALNRQFFKGRRTVTCFTCHKGQKKP